EVDEIAFLVDEPHRGVALNAKLLSAVDVPEISVEVLMTIHFLRLYKLFQFLLVFSEADANDFEALWVQLFVGGLDVRKLGDAGPAPSRPEVHEDNFAFQRSQVDVATVDGLKFQFERLTDPVEFLG